jgi:hypothetical protein
MAFTAQTLDTPTRPPEVHFVPFVTTGATVEVATQLKVITGFGFGHVGSPTVDEVLSIDETVSDFGQIVVPDGGFITVKRAATTTSGLVVSLILFGY